MAFLESDAGIILWRGLIDFLNGRSIGGVHEEVINDALVGRLRNPLVEFRLLSFIFINIESCQITR